MPIAPPKSLVLSCSLLTLIAATNATAEEVFSLDTVVVSASKSAQKQGETDGSMSVVKQESIQKNMASSVDEIFKYTPSVTVSGSGIRGDSPINIRGITGNRVLTNVDGVRQPKALSFGFLSSSRHFLDPNTLKQVEVIPGPASSLYGSDALGGVVSYITKDPDDIFQEEGNGIGGSTNLHYDGSDNGFSKSVSVAGRKGNVESMLVVTQQDGEETENKGERAGTGATRDIADPQDTKDMNILGKVKILSGKGQTLKLTAEQNKTEENTQALSNSLANTVYKDEKQRSRLSAEYQLESATAAFDQVTARLDWQKTDTDQLATYISGGRPSSYDSDYKEDTTVFNLDFEKDLDTTSTAHTLSYGLNTEKTDYEQWRNSSTSGVGRGMPKSASKSVAVYAQDRIKPDGSRLTITPGIRYDSYTIDPQPDALYLSSSPADRAPGKSSETQTSLKLGATYDLNDQHSVFGHVAQGFKAPDMNQLYESFDRPGAYKNSANPNLKPESVDSVELGYRFGTDDTNVEVTAFHNKYENFIEQVNLGAQAGYPMGVFQNQNLSGVTIKGVEAKTSVNVTDNVQVRGAVAYAKGTAEKSGRKQPLNSVAPVHGVVGIGYDAPSKQWGSELSLTASAGKKKEDVDSTTTPFLSPNYNVVDVTAYRKLGKNVRLDAGIFNATDKQYWEWESARNLTATQRSRSEPARHVKVGLTWDF